VSPHSRHELTSPKGFATEKGINSLKIAPFLDVTMHSSVVHNLRAVRFESIILLCNKKICKLTV
jgi:hypothetical protein